MSMHGDTNVDQESPWRAGTETITMVAGGKKMTKVSVYVDTGNVYSYYVDNPFKGREHAAAIIAGGYRHSPFNSNDVEWFPPHRIEKVKVEGAGESSAYRDTARAT